MIRQTSSFKSIKIPSSTGKTLLVSVGAKGFIGFEAISALSLGAGYEVTK